MSRGRHRGVKRLLLVPALVLVLTLTLVIAVGTAAPHRSDPTLRLAGLPELLAVPDTECPHDEARPGPPQTPLLTATGRVSSEQIVACPRRFDGRSVTYVGELVGDLLHRRGGAWVQVNDDEYALTHGPLPAHRQHAGTNSGLSVWLPDELLDEVTGLGRPGVRGDVVSIQGTVVRTDPEDGGGLTLRARRLEVLRPATAVEEPFDLLRAVFAVASILAAVTLAVARRRSS